jgi:LuxR family maltose regulon positive regulatory protein
MLDNLLHTKLMIPPYRPDLVPRPHILKRLDEGLARKLVLVSAPAGFGKTTLLAEWAGAQGSAALLAGARANFSPAPQLPSSTSQFAWLSLDEGDNDPARFLAYLIAALRSADQAIGKTGLEALQTPQTLSISSVVTNLINDVSTSSNRFVLVLDDYHLITSEQVHNSITFLLDKLPPNLHLVIASRTDPPLPIARLRARGQLTEIRAGDLRFTSEEAATFFRELMGLDLSRDDLASLETRTEGWVAGLQLAALAMQRFEDRPSFIRSFAGDNRYIVDYLAGEVLLQQPEAIRAFLLATSILGRLNGSLCDAVLDVGTFERLNVQTFKRSDEILEYLERSNLFLVPLDDKRHWYRYHHLFAEFLLARLYQEEEERVPEHHRRAALWFAENGLLQEAVGHALNAKEYSLAADFIEREAGLKLSQLELNTILNWLGALPEDTLQIRPRLGFLHAWTLLWTGQLDAAEKRVQVSLSGLDEQDAEKPRQARVHAARLKAVQAIIRCYQGAVFQAITLSQKVLQNLPEEDTFLYIAMINNIALNLGAVYGENIDLSEVHQSMADIALRAREKGSLAAAVNVLGLLAANETVQGQLRQSDNTYQQAMELIEQSIQQGKSLPPVAAGVYTGLGELLREWDQLDVAAEHLTRGIEMAAESGDIDLQFTGSLSLARTFLAQGNAEQAAKTLRQTEIVAGTSDILWIKSQMAAFQVRWWLSQGELGAASRWARETDLPSRGNPGYRQADEYLAYARVLIAEGQPEKALDFLVWLREMLEQAGLGKYVLEARLLEALGWKARGDTAQAALVLGQVLEMAEPEGYMRLFLDEGRPLGEILLEMPFQDVPAEYLSRLRAGFRKENQSSMPGAQALIEPLSDRELQVLQLLAAGNSNREIAGELFISIGTVKRHVHHIYQKFGVSNRVQAVAMARKFRLLH